MTLHILKLCVGCDTLEDLSSWQQRRFVELRKSDPGAELMHITRQTPRRDGFAPGSSIYWVIAGYIRARQKIFALREIQGTDGVHRCGLALDPELIATHPLPRRAFQGWRYLPADEAPADLQAWTPDIDATMPPAMRQALAELRLI